MVSAAFHDSSLMSGKKQNSVVPQQEIFSRACSRTHSRFLHGQHWATPRCIEKSKAYYKHILLTLTWSMTSEPFSDRIHGLTTLPKIIGANSPSKVSQLCRTQQNCKNQNTQVLCRSYLRRHRQWFLLHFTQLQQFSGQPTRLFTKKAVTLKEQTSVENDVGRNPRDAIHLLHVRSPMVYRQ